MVKALQSRSNRVLIPQWGVGSSVWETDHGRRVESGFLIGCFLLEVQSGERGEQKAALRQSGA